MSVECEGNFKAFKEINQVKRLSVRSELVFNELYYQFVLFLKSICELKTKRNEFSANNKRADRLDFDKKKITFHLGTFLSRMHPFRLITILRERLSPSLLGPLSLSRSTLSRGTGLRLFSLQPRIVLGLKCLIFLEILSPL